MTDQQLVAVMLPREVVERLATEVWRHRERLDRAGVTQRYRDIAAAGEACEQALANPSVTVEGEVFLGKLAGQKALAPNGFLPGDFPEGPCLVTVTSIKGVSDE